MSNVIAKILLMYMTFCTISWTGGIISYLQHRPDKETRKKWKQICKWEHRDSYRQETFAMKEYIAKYTEEHNVDWNRYI